MSPADLRTYALLVLCAAMLSCTAGLPPEFPAPDFSLKSPLTGTEVSLASLKGKPVILYWFTSW